MDDIVSWMDQTTQRCPLSPRSKCVHLYLAPVYLAQHQHLDLWSRPPIIRCSRICTKVSLPVPQSVDQTTNQSPQFLLYHMSKYSCTCA